LSLEQRNRFTKGPLEAVEQRADRRRQLVSFRFRQLKSVRSRLSIIKTNH
jgi:hypothetical protein